MVRVVGCHLQKGPEESKGSWLWSWWLVVTWKKDLRKGLGYFILFFRAGQSRDEQSVGQSVGRRLDTRKLGCQELLPPSLLPRISSLSLSLPLSLSLSSCLHASQRKRRRKFALVYNRTTISLLTPVEKFALFWKFLWVVVAASEASSLSFLLYVSPPEFVFLHGVTPLQELFFGSPLPSLSLFRVPICD